MSNPFLEPRSLLVELERKRRERVKIGVYLSLGAMSVFLMGLLIQGCKRSEPPPPTPTAETAPTNLAETAPVEPTNPPAPTALTPETNPPAYSAETVPATNPPVTESAATSAPPPSLSATNEAPPPVAATPPPPAEEIYIIKSGDTLGRIAREHNTTVQAIKALNSLRTDRILAGKKLKLPPPTTTTNQPAPGS